MKCNFCINEIQFLELIWLLVYIIGTVLHVNVQHSSYETIKCMLFQTSLTKGLGMFIEIYQNYDVIIHINNNYIIV